MARHRQKRITQEILYNMTDRQLHDIGLTRNTIVDAVRSKYN